MCVTELWLIVSGQVARLCEHVPMLSQHHHNMLYIVSLMPLGQRGTYLRCVLSYVFLRRLIQTPLNIGSFLEIKVYIIFFLTSVIFFL